MKRNKAGKQDAMYAKSKQKEEEGAGNGGTKENVLGRRGFVRGVVGERGVAPTPTVCPSSSQDG